MSSTSQDGLRLKRRGNDLLRALDHAAASHARAVAALVIVALLAFLPGFFQIPPVDRDEARFAQATKQMVETGDYVDIRYQDEVRYKKPVGIYWLQSVWVKGAEAVGVYKPQSAIWIYRLPSLFGAIGAVLLTYWAALAFVPRRAALMAGLMMATSVLLGVEARLAKTDAALLAAAMAAMAVMARAYLGSPGFARPGLAGWGLPAAFWTALAIGILLKGPLILLFVGLAAGALFIADRAWRWILLLRPLPGLAWMLLLVLPWFLAIVGRAGDDFFAASLGQDMLSKVTSGQESHGAPPGYYLLLYWATFWPAATLTLMALPAIWAAREERGARFLIAWIVPAWVVFELVMTKLPHYVLPLYPAIAILIAGVVEAQELRRDRWLTRGASWWFVLPAILGVGGVVALIVLGRQIGLFAWPFAAGSIICGLLAWRLYEADGAERSLLRAMAASVLIAFGIYGVVLPSLPSLFPSNSLARILRAAGCENPVAASAGYHEPSLVFLAGTQTRLTDGVGAADFLRQGPCRFAFVEARSERSFLRRAEAIGLRYRTASRVEGFNIAAGRSVSIAVYRSEGEP